MSSWHDICSLPGIVTSIRSQASSLVLIASLVAMLIGPGTAASHEVCSNAMRHGCASIDALASCCCGDQSNTNPSRAPSEGANITGVPHAVVSTVVFVLPPAIASVLHGGPAPIARPPDLSILFGDLRI
jgi:hypothetical protein